MKVSAILGASLLQTREATCSVGLVSIHHPYPGWLGPGSLCSPGWPEPQIKASSFLFLLSLVTLQGDVRAQLTHTCPCLLGLKN